MGGKSSPILISKTSLRSQHVLKLHHRKLWKGTCDERMSEEKFQITHAAADDDDDPSGCFGDKD